jgi:hypothetical protein
VRGPLRPCCRRILAPAAVIAAVAAELPMMEHTMSPLSAWESFYVIVGSSGAALTGLQFVVIALLGDDKFRSTGTTRDIDTWGTPTIVHFCTVLLVSAIVSAPWRWLSSAGLTLGLCGVAGVVYGLVTLRRARTITQYKPMFEDWLWHIVLPLFTHGLLIASAIALTFRPALALFGVAAVTLLLLFIGIHNAWDTVTYVAVGQWEDKNKPQAT